MTATARSDDSVTRLLSTAAPGARAPGSAAKTGGRATAQVAASAATAEPGVRVIPMQAVPRTFRTSIEGKVIYALDDRSFKKIQQRMVTPLSTAVVSLGVLCGFPWENYAVAMWCGVIISSGWATYTHSREITRATMIPVEPLVRDTHVYPRGKAAVERPDHWLIERVGLPFFKTPVDKLVDGPLTRVSEALFPPQFVALTDVATASVRPCWTRVIIDTEAAAAKAVKMLFYVDQIRDLDRFNQLLSRQTNGSVAEADARAKDKRPAAKAADQEMQAMHKSAAEGKGTMV